MPQATRRIGVIQDSQYRQYRQGAGAAATALGES